MSFYIKIISNGLSITSFLYKDPAAESVATAFYDDVIGGPKEEFPSRKYADQKGVPFPDLVFSEYPIEYMKSVVKLDSKTNKYSYANKICVDNTDISFYDCSFSAFLCKVNLALSKHSIGGFSFLLDDLLNTMAPQYWVLPTELLKEVQAILVANFDEYAAKELSFFQNEKPDVQIPADPKAIVA